jgi:hypothetical protein
LGDSTQRPKKPLNKICCGFFKPFWINERH